MKRLYREIFDYVPLVLKDIILGLWSRLRAPKLVAAAGWYKYSDEHLKFVHILEAISYLRVAGAGGRVLPQTFFEFGCHSGRTFSAAINAANYFQMKNMDFYAFDSFKGLPETNEQEDGYFRAGSFCTSRADFLLIVRKKTGLQLIENNIVEGYYSDSLTPDLQSRMPKAGVVHIDVDLYSSTVDVLRFLCPLLVEGSLILFDDWYCFPPKSGGGGGRANARRSQNSWKKTQVLQLSLGRHIPLSGSRFSYLNCEVTKL